MKSVNLFYISLVLITILLFSVFRPDFHKELSFYGVAESRATEINYNYPVVVDEILVKPGQSVKAGQVIMRLSRRKSKESLDDQQFRITQLQAEETLWQRKLENEIMELRLEEQAQLAEIDRKISKVEQELSYRKSLFDSLQTITPTESAYNTFATALANYQKEREELAALYAAKIGSLNDELALGESPFQAQVKRYEAEQAFEEAQSHIPIEVKAPTDGLIGNISCREEEHIPAYSTLMTIYEPHSGIIKGYVHEDLTLEVELGQSYTISSLKDDSIRISGKVIGLGSRIVEIPARLRKIEVVKAYGREVLLEIPTDNTFLQKEKVGIAFCSSCVDKP